MKLRYWLAAAGLATLIAPMIPSPAALAAEPRPKIPFQVQTADGRFIVEMDPNVDREAVERCRIMVKKGLFGKASLTRQQAPGHDEVRVSPGKPTGLPGLPLRTRPLKLDTTYAVLRGDTLIVTLGPNPTLARDPKVRPLGLIMGESYLRSLPLRQKIPIAQLGFLLI